MIKIAVCGAAGRMGGRIIVAVHEAEGVELSGALERVGHPMLGQDAGTSRSSNTQRQLRPGQRAPPAGTGGHSIHRE